VHGATSPGGQWTGVYDTSGNLACRAPPPAATCTGGPTGAPLSYDAEGRLAAWQNTPAIPTLSPSPRSRHPEAAQAAFAPHGPRRGLSRQALREPERPPDSPTSIP
jgi:hypothetical protein